MAGANPEQLKAIENFGGALLSAGAGSGKTFVLTEHLVHLATQWVNDYKADQDGIFDQYIKSKLSKVVLMTFTKKAAGEIGIRIGQKFQRALDEAIAADHPSAPLWEKTLERLDALTVSTIHGYCYKLIKQGFFAQVNPNDDIIGEAEFAKQIEDIFSLWLEENLERSDLFFQTILKEKRAVLTSLKSIVADPTLRLMWQKMDPERFELDTVDEVIKDLLWHQSFNEIFEDKSPLGLWSDFKDKDWFKFLERFESFRNSFDFSLHALNAWIVELSNEDWKIPRAPGAKAVPQDAKDFYKQVKEFKDFLKKNEEDLLLFQDHGLKQVKLWYGQFRELFSHVEKAYRSAPGFTFGDLEYIVNEQLDSSSAREMVKNEYDYIIVDEFQDTSFIQFNILSKIVDSDYSKVFCVGDVKQAIYGFRGGELGVFLEMEQKTPLQLSLLHNYRSDKDVINFNNALFDYLFKLGLGFEGRDHYAVKVERQTIPLADRANGKIFEIETNLEFLQDELEKLSVSDVEYLEALALAQNIQGNIESDGGDTAVLYRKLKPSKILMQLLLAMDIGFTSQVKVPMLEDPILGVFNLLIKNRFDQGKLKDKYLEFALISYFKLLGAQTDNVIDEAKRFENNIGFYGLYQSFLIFMSSTGLVVSNYKNNLENIRLLIEMNQGDLGKIATKMDEWSELQYSLDFQYGKDPHKVVLMSAHASKGLEFPRVLLGGIYTNDSSMGMKDMFGKSPYSFKWSQALTGKKKYKSPHYMLELAVQKRKEFSESKRLFYVACTRAESELGWVKLEFGTLKATVAKGSWISGLEKFFQNSEEGMLFYKQMSHTRASSDLRDVFDINFLQKMSNQPPMFHFDNLGVESRLDQAQAFLMPELSVTRLAQVSQCPRKFYLQNILKLESSELFKEDSKSMDVEELTAKSFSSSERGIEVHDAIAQAIDNSLTPIEDLGYMSQVEWVVENLKKFEENTNFISEKPIKFELFEYMISGIPDLIIQDSEHHVEVWDFKTGRLKAEVPESYWFQLKTYAYAMFTLEKGEKLKPIKLVLCYVDEKQMVEQIVSKEDVEKYLWDFASKFNAADETNTSHCEHCDFNKICNKQSLSSCAPSFSC
ncbi:MAG: UvrD-helicase domain-containing protein [Bacteriovoracaceae bacterium]|nr:UvrD-helicase domain-containing protein [Bacteriovoracaceae bacterium]